MHPASRSKLQRAKLTFLSVVHLHLQLQQAKEKFSVDIRQMLYNIDQLMYILLCGTIRDL
jgi:hypothetical protein